jgi:hypothetical protein
MTNGYFGSPAQNRVLTGTLSAGSEASAGPVANLQDDVGAIGWVTDAALSSHVDIDAGSAVDWRVFGIFRTNLTEAASLTVSLGTTQGADDVYAGTPETGLAAGHGQLVHDAGEIHSARWCRLAVADPANPDLFLRVGLGFAGPVWIPGRNPTAGSAMGREDSVDEMVAKGGQEYPTLNWQRRAWDIGLEALGEAEAIEELYELDRIARYGGNVLFVPFPGGAWRQREAVFGRLRGGVLTFTARTRLYRSWRGRITERL